MRGTQKTAKKNSSLLKLFDLMQSTLRHCCCYAVDEDDSFPII